MADKRGWVGQLGQDEFSLSDAIGGWRGAVESLLPGLLFVVLYVTTHDLPVTLGVSIGASLAFVVARLLQRTPLVQAFAGLLGVGIGVVWAALSGKAENYFAWGLITNIAFLTVFLVSLLARRPAVLLLLKAFLGFDPADLDAEERRLLLRQSVRATWVWVGVFGIRVTAQAPLYFAGAVGWLGTIKLVLGLPLFAFGGWLTWVLLRGVMPDRHQVMSEDEQREEDRPKH